MNRLITLYKNFIFLIFLGCFIPFVSFAQENLATTDYQAYKSTRFASDKWDNFVKEGMIAFYDAHYDVAQANHNKAYSMGCQSPIVLFQLALMHEYQRSYYSAFKFYDQAREKFKEANSDHRYAQTFEENYGRALYDSGKMDEAVPMLQKAAKKSKSFWLLKLVGMIAFDQNDTLNATSYFERAVRIQSPEVTPSELVFIYTLLGRIYVNKGEKDGALRYYQKVLEFDAQNKEANYVVSRLQKSYQEEDDGGGMKAIYEQISDDWGSKTAIIVFVIPWLFCYKTATKHTVVYAFRGRVSREEGSTKQLDGPFFWACVCILKKWSHEPKGHYDSRN